MTPRSAALALLLLVPVSVGAVQLIDPTFDDGPPPEVDFSAPPAEVAADSAARLEHVDYAYRIDLADDPDGPWEQLRVVRVEHSDREYRKVGPLGERGVVIYGTESGGFVRPGSDGRWRFLFHPDIVYPVPTLSQPFRIDRIRHSRTTVLADNESVLVLRIDSNPMKFVDVLPGKATITVNKTDRTIETVIAAYDTGPTGIRYARFRRTSDAPDVRRPPTLGPSFEETAWDLLRGPLFRPFSS